MGLELVVGIVAQSIRNGEDPKYWRDQFSRMNDYLRESELPEHQEPETLEQGFSASMYGYWGLHFLRRVASHLAVHGTLPPPISSGDEPEDRVVKKYYATLERWIQRTAKLPDEQMEQAQVPAYIQLLCHGDSEGLYLPLDCTFPIVGPSGTIPGGCA